MNSNGTQERKLRIMVTPLDGHGHINGCHGFCEEFRDRGHEVVFVLDKAFAGRVTKYGFKERLLVPPEDEAANADKEMWPDFVARNAHRYEKTPIEQIGDVIVEAFGLMFDKQKKYEQQYQAAIDEIKPDLIIHDGYVCLPQVVNSKIPWIWFFSAAPHVMLNDERIPPFLSGLPIDGDRAEWDKFRAETHKVFAKLQKSISDHNVAQGGQPLPMPRTHPLSDFLNLYMMPKELRYEEVNDLPEHFVAIDCFVRSVPEQTFEIPEQLRNKPGKLVFFSMGSFGCANRKMMTRLVAMLAKSKHRFIVAKGPLDYELPGDNMYGEAFVPQMAVLPLVDLVVTHGGNNTVTETFYFGKKMLVMPTFFDQHDNAQRIAEVGLGIKLNPFTCTEQELLDSIDKLLDDEQLTERMDQIGQRIRSSYKQDRKRLVDLIESKLH